MTPSATSAEGSPGAARPARIFVVAHGRRLPGSRRSAEAEFSRRLAARFAGMSVTTGPGETPRLVREAVAAGADCVVVVGGDGTVREALSALRGTDVALGLVPEGTGNDFAFHFGMRPGFAEGVRRLADYEVARVDRLDVNGHAVVTAAVWGSGVGVGQDTDRLRARFRDWEKLPRAVKGAAYQVAAASHLLRDPDEPFVLLVTADDAKEPARYRAWSAAVGDGRRIGGAFLAFPDADKEDGQAELLVVENGPWRERVWTAALLRFGLHRARPGVRTRRFRRASLELDRPMPWMADGEILPPERRFEAEVHPAALPLLLPRYRVPT